MKLKSALLLFSLGLGVVASVTASSVGCSSSPKASATKITTRSQLIGGQRALGEIGDYKISNGIIHAIVQDVGNSRGFGAFGGSLIDVDLVRGGTTNPATGTAGHDFFTEMFPAFFLEAIEPRKVEVVADGSEGPAIIRVSGKGGDFLSLAGAYNDLLFGKDAFDYQVDYILEPGKQYLKIVTTVTNPDPLKDAPFFLAMPFGFVTLLGEGQRLFIPGKAGYDMRFTLEDLYKTAEGKLDALPGVVSSMVTTEGEGVSYALAASPRGALYMRNAREKYPGIYPDAKNDSLLIPLASGSFLGSFWGAPPTSLAPKKSYSFTGYLAVGTGDVASAQKVIYGISDDGGRQPVATGSVIGHVREKGSLRPVAGATVVFRDDKGNYVSSAVALTDGSYSAPLPPGNYTLAALDSVRTPVKSTETVTVSEGSMSRVDFELERTAMLTVSVRDENGRPLPSKVSVEAVYENPNGQSPRKFLYDLGLGERMRVSDLDQDDPTDPATRRYLEKSFFLTRGFGGRNLRPGTYKVYASRGMEYDVASQVVVLKSGEEKKLEFQLQHVVPTQGYISTDLHVHSINSVDSAMTLDQRITSYAAEGVDFLSSTDHNFVSDYKPTVEALGLQDFVKTTIGLELTTLEMGHFNAFPLKLQPGPVTHGSFNWFRRPPGELFAQLRGLGVKPEKTLVQVNHPRDTIMGYFNGFDFGSYTGKAMPPASFTSLDPAPLADGSMSPYDRKNFSLDFDLIEVFNSKRLEMTFHYRIPKEAPEGPDPKVPNCGPGVTGKCIPPVGEILEETKTAEDPSVPGGSYTYRKPVHPGALEDYYMLLSRGYRMTAVGNSDSHSASSEAGTPRTFVYVGPTAEGSMQALPEEAVMDGLKNHKAIVTNGPFVEMWVNEKPVGSDVVVADGNIQVRVKVQAAPWVDVTKVLLKRGGKDMDRVPEVLAEISVPTSKDLVRLDEIYSFKNIPDDSFLVAEVRGEKSLWPVVTPNEFRSIPVSEAVRSVGAAFGLSNDFGRFVPNEVQQAVPFAFTNPIWVSRSVKQRLVAAKKIMPLAENPKRPPAPPLNILKIFSSLHSDAD